MTAILALQEQLREVQYKQHFLVDDNGIVMNWARYEYATLAKRAADIRKGIQLLESITQDKTETLQRGKG